MTVTDSATALLGYTQRQVDRLVPPPSRQKAWDQTAVFASARPLLFTFLLAQLTLSFLPLVIFASFVLSVLAFAAGCAIVFTLFWLGVALLFLVPTLVVTGGIGVLVWAWAVASFIVARWAWGFVPDSIKPRSAETPTANGDSSGGVDFAGDDKPLAAKKEGDVPEHIL